MKINYGKRTICDDLGDTIRRAESGEITIESIELTKDEWEEVCETMNWNAGMKNPHWGWCPIIIAK